MWILQRKTCERTQTRKNRERIEKKRSAEGISVFLFLNVWDYDIIAPVIIMDNHVSVLRDEAISYLNIRPEGTYVDMTLGGGGHSAEILKRLTSGRLFACDQDLFAIARAKEVLEPSDNVFYIHDNFRHIRHQLAQHDVQSVDGFLFDLGVSSFQFDIPERGFSYQFEARLDMRMNEDDSLTAYDIVNSYKEKALADVLFRYGEEPYARAIARRIMDQRIIRPIETTLELVDIVKEALPAKVLRQKGHPAKRVFQALRIAVNDELGALEQALNEAIMMLRPKGRIVTITFHSLEDRICKHIFQKWATIELPKNVAIISHEEPILNILTKRVVIPSDAEILANNRAHSAKLRAVEKRS